jgi:alpha-L-fucosidase
LCFSQQDYVPSEDNLVARKWFQDAKFGLFIHWGIYSVLGDGEWVMHKQNISIEEYEKLATFFNPTYFNADEWVLMAKNAGMKDITVLDGYFWSSSLMDNAVGAMSFSLNSGASCGCAYFETYNILPIRNF